MKYCLIAAHDINRGIGKNNQIPWKLKGEMRLFRLTTSTASISESNCVVMGRKTWESIPEKYRPLKGRKNIVITSSEIPGVTTFKDFDELDKHFSLEEYTRCFFIGGVKIYETCLKRYKLDEIHLTEIFEDYQCDTFLPSFSLSEYIKNITSVKEEGGIYYRYSLYIPDKPKCSGEKNYLNLLNYILRNGIYTEDRTKVGTFEIFEDLALSFDLERFPLLTSKRVAFRILAEELFFFLSGKTDNRILQAKGVKIWEGNSSREYLDRIGQCHRKEGDLGKFYGFQWRHWGEEYVNCETENYKGLDQIAELIKQIKNTPESRRLILTSWNPADLSNVCLPPCHVLYQFHVNKRDSELSCHVYQRSADMFLGVPFNIASFALFTYLLAKTCDLTPKRLIISYGNAHIYKNHLSAIDEQLKRKNDLYEFPQLKILNKRDKLEDYTFEDLELIGYKHHPTIKAEMAV